MVELKEHKKIVEVLENTDEIVNDIIPENDLSFITCSGMTIMFLVDIINIIPKGKYYLRTFTLACLFMNYIEKITEKMRSISNVEYTKIIEKASSLTLWHINHGLEKIKQSGLIQPEMKRFYSQKYTSIRKSLDV